MQFQKSFYFESDDYDHNGMNKFNPEVLFIYKIKEFEKEFIEEYTRKMAANHLFANPKTMLLIERCFQLDTNETFGMEIINGEVDIETNLKMEEHSENETTYAIGSFLDESEPLFLVIDDDMFDNQLLLKYVSDSEEEVDEIVPVVQTEKVKV